MSRRTAQSALLLATVAWWGLSLVGARYPEELALQHAPTAIILAAAAIAVRKQRISTPALTCILAFLWLHILGARYIYSFVPYDRWAREWLGEPLSPIFGWQRNHYDRLVHFGFGLLAILPAREWAVRGGGLTNRWASLFALVLVLALSQLYEIGEWLLTVVVSPVHAEAYNGQQGDFWDAQKDSALALAGALLALGTISLYRPIRSAQG
jgi:putative membrane protein